MATIVNDDGGGGGPVTATFTIASGGDDVNEEGTSFVPDSALWVGNGSSSTASFLGLRFTGVSNAGRRDGDGRSTRVRGGDDAVEHGRLRVRGRGVGEQRGVQRGVTAVGATLLVPRVTHASDAQWVSGTRYALEDISAIVQAAVNQPAWAAAGPEHDRARDGECLGAQVHQCRRGRRRQCAAAGGHLRDRRQRLAEPAAGDHRQRAGRRRRGRRRWR